MEKTGLCFKENFFGKKMVLLCVFVFFEFVVVAGELFVEEGEFVGTLGEAHHLRLVDKFGDVVDGVAAPECELLTFCRVRVLRQKVLDGDFEAFAQIAVVAFGASAAGHAFRVAWEASL